MDTLLLYTLWYEFSNVFVAQSDFGKKNSQKSTHLDHSYLKYTLAVFWLSASLPPGGKMYMFFDELIY